MRFRSGPFGLGAVLALILAANSLTALANTNTDTDEKGLPSPEAAQVESLSVADGLVDLGMTNRDPLLLVAAAKIVRGIPTQAAQRSPQTTDVPPPGAAQGQAAPAVPTPGVGGGSLDALLGGSGTGIGGGTSRDLDLGTLLGGGAGADTGTGSAAPAQAEPSYDTTREIGNPETFEEIIAAARSFAGGQPTILAVIDEVARLPAPATTRGRVGGPGFNRARIGSRGNHYYWITFRGRRTATVSMRGAGYSDLDLFIYDENGNRVCRDTKRADRGYCRWVPRWTGPFKVQVRNYGSRRNHYTLRTN